MGNRESTQPCKQDGDVKSLKKKKKLTGHQCEEITGTETRGRMSVYMLLDTG